MKKIIIVLFLSLNVINAQENSDQLSSLFKITYNLIGLEIAYEVPVAKKITVDLGFGLGAGNSVTRTFISDKKYRVDMDFNSFPSVRLKSKLKYIYNVDKRIKKNKKVKHNSGNYLGLQVLYTSKQSKSPKITSANNALLTEAHWGLQRSLGNKWLFNFQTGIGFIQDIDTSLNTIYPTLSAQLSYIIF